MKGMNGMKKEIIEKIKQRGYEFEVREIESRTEMILCKKNESQNVNISDGELTSYFYTNYSVLDVIEKEVILLIMKEKEKEAKQKGKWFIIDANFPNELGVLLKENGYMSLENQSDIDIKELEILTDEEIGDYDFFVSPSTFEDIKERMNLYEEAQTFLKNYQEKEELYYYQRDYMDAYIHVEGMDVIVWFSVVKEGLKIEIQNQKRQVIHSFIFRSMEEFVEKIEEWMVKTKKQQRIKKVFQPSSFFFEKMFSMFLFAELTHAMTKKIYTFLEEEYTPDDIEKMAAFYVKSEFPRTYRLNERNIFFYFKNKGFIIDSTKKDVYVVEKSPQIKENIQKILREKFEEELTKNLEDIS